MCYTFVCFPNFFQQIAIFREILYMYQLFSITTYFTFHVITLIV